MTDELNGTEQVAMDTLQAEARRRFREAMQVEPIVVSVCLYTMPRGFPDVKVALHPDGHWTFT